MEEQEQEQEQPQEQPQEQEDYRAKFEEAQAELAKLKEKDHNFEKVRKMTGEEKEKHNEEKGELQKTVEELQGRLQSISDTQKTEWRDNIISSVIGDEPEKMKDVMAEYEILNMPSETRDDVVARTQKALKLAGYEIGGDAKSLSFGGSRDSVKTEKKFHETERGQEVAKFFAPHLFANKDNDK